MIITYKIAVQNANDLTQNELKIKGGIAIKIRKTIKHLEFEKISETNRQARSHAIDDWKG